MQPLASVVIPTESKDLDYCPKLFQPISLYLQSIGTT
jgi:hypothetical protein